MYLFFALCKDFNVSLHQVPIDVHKNDKYVINGSYANETRLKVKHLLEEDGGSYWCQAAFQLGESEEHIELVVLSFMVPLKPFLIIIAEVILLVAIILLCEVYTQKKKNDPGKISYFFYYCFIICFFSLFIFFILHT